MDLEQAKFILSSFRPDGSDTHDPAFAEALTLATQDSNLATWLTEERARDAAFAAVLNEIKIPSDLRDAIHRILAATDNQTQPALGELDSSFISALAHLTPPPGLREQILSAMNIEKQTIARPNKPWGWISGLAAAAAALAMAFIFLGPGANQAVASISPDEITKATIDHLTSPQFSHDLKNPQQSALHDWLKNNGLPLPSDLPEGLKNISGLGCKKLQIGKGKIPASLVCFRKSDNEVVHLVVLKKENLTSPLHGLMYARENCTHCEITGWSEAQWSNEEYAFFLLTEGEPETLTSLF